MVQTYFTVTIDPLMPDPGTIAATGPLPSWLVPGVVVSYRGGTEKVLMIDGAHVETVSSDRFFTWHAPTFLSMVAAGEIEHRPDGRRIRPPANKPAVLRDVAGAAQLFAALYSRLGGSGQPHEDVLRWMRAVSEGLPAPPWQHLIGMLLIEIGAEHAGLGARVANPIGRGRRSSRQKEATDTQALIKHFDLFLAGGEPVSAQEWAWLRSLVERGMICVGLLARPATPRVGRPEERFGIARLVLVRLGNGRDGQARCLREVAHDVLLRKRQVEAAWRDEDHTRITIQPSDRELTDELARVRSYLHKIRQRAAVKEGKVRRP